eukprot:scaffold98255_cov60-Phaeocystis_antarctica.AAC.2
MGGSAPQSWPSCSESWTVSATSDCSTSRPSPCITITSPAPRAAPRQRTMTRPAQLDGHRGGVESELRHAARLECKDERVLLRVPRRQATRQRSGPQPEASRILLHTHPYLALALDHRRRAAALDCGRRRRHHRHVPRDGLLRVVAVRITRVDLQPCQLARHRLGAGGEAQAERTRLARAIRHLEHPTRVDIARDRQALDLGRRDLDPTCDLRAHSDRGLALGEHDRPAAARAM